MAFLKLQVIHNECRPMLHTIWTDTANLLMTFSDRKSTVHNGVVNRSVLLTPRLDIREPHSNY
jgi:hypothetical protein